MRFRFAGGLDLVTGALIAAGAVLLAAAIVTALVLLAPPSAAPGSDTGLAPTPLGMPGRPSHALPADHVAAVLYVDAGVGGAGGATRVGDRVDVLGYFSRQVTGADNVTRTLLADVLVLGVERAGGSIALTLAVAQDQALLLHEAEALGVHAFVSLRATARGGEPSTSGTFSDADLARRLTGGS